MNFNELGSFSEKLAWAASVQGRSIGKTEAKDMFKFIEDLPLDTVLLAIERAIRRRDPDDIFLKTALITGPEIRQAAEEIIAESRSEGDVGSTGRCKICDGMGWIANVEDEKGCLIAWPCECLYKTAKDTLARKQRPTAAAEETRKCCKSIVAAYEYHQRKWGGGK